MISKFMSLALALSLASQSTIVSAKKKQLLNSNPELTEKILSKLKPDPYNWNYKKTPYIHFTVGTDGKARSIEAIQDTKTTNVDECIAAIFRAEPFDTQFYGKSYGYECKPKVVYTKKQIRKANKYIQNYMTNLQKRIKKNWHPVTKLKNYSAIAKFTIDQNGNAQNLKFKEKTGNEEADSIAIRAIELSSPFDKPDFSQFLDSSQEEIEIEFSFDFRRHTANTTQSKLGAGALGLGIVGAIGAAALLGSPSRRYRYRPYRYRRRY